MSPTIRSKGGQPLFIGGQVAGSGSCCCEDTPPACLVPDLCSYFIELDNPSEIALKSPAFECFGDGSGVFKSVNVEEFGFGVVAPSGFTYVRGSRSSRAIHDRGGVYSSSGEGNVISAGAYFFAEYSNNEYDWLFIQIYASVSCFFYYDYTDRPRLLVVLETQVDYINRISSWMPITGRYQSVRRVGVEAVSYCLYHGTMNCASGVASPPNGFRYATTPIEITASNGQTTIGQYSVAYESGYGVEQSLLKSLHDSVVSGVSAAFKVTQRPSCSTAGCHCGSDLYGLRLTLGYFTAVIGEYYFFENEITYRVSSALQSGGWSVVLWEKDSEQRFIKMLRVDIYCNASSGEAAWYAYIRTRCIEYDNQGATIYDSTDSWMGTFDCYKSCQFSAEDSGGFPHVRADGEPIPLGDVQNVEYLGRESIYPECEPPDFPDVRIGQVETC